jgi:hypothetical protein
MTRKDFVLIAQAIKSLPSFECKQDGDVVRFSAIVASFTEALASTNPRFDRERFEKACKGKASIGTPASDGGLKRDVKAKRSAKAKALSAAQEAIEREDTVCFDVAAEHGQIFGNVKGMKWFVDAVAEAL